MISVRPEYLPVYGKTYSLFGPSASTIQYYETVRKLADDILEKEPDIRKLLKILKRLSSQNRLMRILFKNRHSEDLMSMIISLTDNELKVYTENSEEHLKTLSPPKRMDPRLATTREQYHLYMLEIELTNRLFADDFKKADRKIALLPYCLQNFSADCRSEMDGFDYRCRHCSLMCFQNHASKMLKSYHIEPFIWTAGDMKKLAKYTFKEKRSFAVLGIACIPELLWGMRNCRDHNIPVAGLPLNANRCVRWYGEFFPNSIDLDELEKLVSR
jgi:hypothetical protein